MGKKPAQKPASVDFGPGACLLGDDQKVRNTWDDPWVKPPRSPSSALLPFLGRVPTKIDYRRWPRVLYANVRPWLETG